MSFKAENDKKLIVKHTLAGLSMTALSSSLIAVGMQEFALATYLLIFGIILGALYFVKEFPYWFQKVMDVWQFYMAIKPIAQKIQEDSPNIDTSRAEIKKALDDINIQMNLENPDIIMNNGALSADENEEVDD